MSHEHFPDIATLRGAVVQSDIIGLGLELSDYNQSLHLFYCIISQQMDIAIFVKKTQ